MPIRQRGDTWWIDVRTPGGKRIRCSAGTSDRKAAQEYHDRLKAEMWRNDKIGEAPTRTFDEAAVRFLTICKGQADYAAKVRHIAHFRRHFAGVRLDKITADTVFDALPTHSQKGNQKPVEMKPATRNRYLATIRRMMNLCVDWRWIDYPPKLRRQSEPRVRVRWITPLQARNVIDALTMQWMKDISIFALATGMRAGEILSLPWAQVNIQQRVAYVTAKRAKSGHARAVPLNADAIAVLKSRQGTHEELVFTRNGKAITQTDSKMLKRACVKAGVLDFRFHDFRHTWASWHAQAGTSLYVLKELGGWEQLEMVQKYAHLSPVHLAAHANVVTFWSQQAPDAEKPPCTAALTA